MARKKIIAGNWKMNMTPSQAVELINTLKPLVANDEVDVLLCVPAIDIIPAMEAAKGSNIMIGAENMYFEEKGAFTGEISPAMLDDAGVKYVIIGHSERREYFAVVFNNMFTAFQGYYEKQLGYVPDKELLRILTSMRLHGFLELIKGDYDMEHRLFLTKAIGIHADAGTQSLITYFKSKKDAHR